MPSNKSKQRKFPISAYKEAAQHVENDVPTTSVCQKVCILRVEASHFTVIYNKD